MRLIYFLGDRFLQLIIVVFTVSTLTFLLLRLTPGDPAYILLHANDMPVSETAIDALREDLGLTAPLWVQYGQWLMNVFTWQWGDSYVSNEPVITELLSRFPATVELAAAGLLVMLAVTVGLGVLTAVFSNGWIDRTGRVLAIIGAAVPSFWLALLMIYFFSVKQGWFPTMGRGEWEHLVLPSLTLGLGIGAVYARVLRKNMLEMFNQNFVKASMARGLSKSHILMFQVFKHASMPIVTMLGTNFAFMLGGSIIVETIFNWPGLGSYIIEAINARDYPVIQGYVIFASILFVSIHILVDLIFFIIDPRLRT
ncbi:nickel ABC transporter permease [Alteribacillus bidgolensis]|uniref:Nickel import system permease protein NikB n=1 Tax=Alteribacillus bidgolensis TaxID=930129 RepID=A0A1G8EMR4_9BACI|nr:nickel ABC transporter permease [Alteribacillus bidgolensis]SDH71187.1 peptide/nickel transport system permease protein [Alteribacillus bidgolensis]